MAHICSNIKAHFSANSGSIHRALSNSNFSRCGSLFLSKLDCRLSVTVIFVFVLEIKYFLYFIF